MLKGWLLAGLAAVVALGTPGDIYQWTYDQLALGPGWRGHVFANRTGEEVVGLELLLAEVGPVQVLVVGGNLVQAPVDSGGLAFTGRVVPGGVVTVALPEGTALHGAAWVTPAGRVPIAIEPPIPRIDAETIWPVVVILDRGGAERDQWSATREQYPDSGANTKVPIDPGSWQDNLIRENPGASGGDRGEDKPSQRLEQTVGLQFTFIWPPDLDPGMFRAWEGYPYLVRLDGRRSFSPVGKEILAWRWTWEDGLVQEGPVVVRGFDRPGIYRVRLTVTDSSGGVQTLTRFVEAANWEAALADWLDKLGLDSAWMENTTKPMETRDPNSKERPEAGEIPGPGTRTPGG